MTFEPGQVTGNYHVDANVGTGVYTTEYLATDTRTGAPVVLKVLGQRHQETGLRFSEVARAMQSVRSSDVIGILDVGETDTGQPFLVRSPHDRGTLYDRLRLGRPANDDDLRRIVRFLGGALKALNKAGLVHGDLRPTNVLISAGQPEAGVEFGLLWEDDQLLLGDPAPSVHSNAESDAAEGDNPTDLAAASQLVAEAALGRCRGEDETWSDLLVAVSGSGRFELAAALGSSVGAASADGDIGRWTDMLSAPFAAPRRERRTVSPAVQRLAVRAGVGVAILIAIGGVWLGQPGPTAPEAQAFAETATPVPTATPTPTPVPPPRDDLGEADALLCVDQGSDAVADFGLTNVTHDAIEVAWSPVDVTVWIAVNGTEVAQVEPGERGHTVQRLAPDTLYVIEADLLDSSSDQAGVGQRASVVCAQTFDLPQVALDPGLAVPAPGAKVIVVD